MLLPRLNQILKNGKAVFLAYDQGLEHGPKDFNLTNVNPEYILDIALEGKFDGVILQNGIAEKYYHGPYKDIPLIVKLNGKSSLTHISPFSTQLCSVRRAVNLGAKAVGYTIYDGSAQEPTMFAQFSKIVEEAHNLGLPVIAWMYPRGESIHNDTTTDILAYSARIALELGADIVKLKFNNDIPGFKWVVKNAGRTKVVVAGGPKLNELDFLKQAENIMKTGASGLAVGRNIWQSEKPFALAKALIDIVHYNKTFEDVKKYF